VIGVEVAPWSQKKMPVHAQNTLLLTPATILISPLRKAILL